MTMMTTMTMSDRAAKIAHGMHARFVPRAATLARPGTIAPASPRATRAAPQAPAFTPVPPPTPEQEADALANEMLATYQAYGGGMATRADAGVKVPTAPVATAVEDEDALVAEMLALAGRGRAR